MNLSKCPHCGGDLLMGRVRLPGYGGYLSPYVDKIVALATAGKTHIMIADVLFKDGIRPPISDRGSVKYLRVLIASSVRNILESSGIAVEDLNVRKFRERREAIVAHREQGKTYAEISRIAGVSGSRVAQIIANEQRRSRRNRRPDDLAVTDETVIVDAFDLDARVRHCLINEAIVTVGDLKKMTIDQLLKIPNFGKTSAIQLRRAMRTKGIEI